MLILDSFKLSEDQHYLKLNVLEVNEMIFGNLINLESYDYLPKLVKEALLRKIIM